MKLPVHRLALHLMATLLLLAFDALAQEKEPVIKSYPLYQTEAEPILQAVRELIAPKGKVFHNRASGQLVVTAAPEDHVHVSALLNQINIPLRNIRLDVVTKETASHTQTSAGVDGSGKVIITPGNVQSQVKLRPHISARSGTEDSMTSQMLVIQSGGEGFISVGEDIPYTEWLYEFGRNGTVIEQDFKTRRVGAFLRVSATVIGSGPLIQVRITPELSRMVDGRIDRIQFTKVATEATVADGQSLAIGGLTKDSEFFDKFLVGIDSGGNKRRMEMTVTPRILRDSDYK